MSHGKHKCNKPATSPTYSQQWSGVSYARHCPHGCRCSKCDALLHLEGGSHYCPGCDDFVACADDCRHQ